MSIHQRIHRLYVRGPVAVGAGFGGADGRDERYGDIPGPDGGALHYALWRIYYAPFKMIVRRH